MSLSEQIVNHKEQLKELQRQLEDHLQIEPLKSTKRLLRHSFKVKKEFLSNEIKRYDVYKSILEEKHDP